MKEGAHINRSLLALGNCIKALSHRTSTRYINYRDSKLTRLLKVRPGVPAPHSRVQAGREPRLSLSRTLSAMLSVARTLWGATATQ